MPVNPKETRTLPRLGLSLVSVAIGIVAGLGAVAFRALIAFFHNLLFLGKVSAIYDANAHTPPSPWGPLVILVPVIGAAGVAFLVKNFAPEAKGHGVPEVMDAIYYHKGIIRPVVALVKALASALSIGSGGSIGREGPIIQIGSSFGSTVGQLLNLPIWQRITLIAAGAGGGIAATFNTPIGGVLFAAEIMMHEVSARTLVPVAIATATATYVGRFFFGPHSSFVIPAIETFHSRSEAPLLLLSYVGLGIIMGLVSTLFIKSIYRFEDIFERRINANYYLQHMSAMLIAGALMYGLMSLFGHYYIEGVGYATIQDILSGRAPALYVLVLLFFLKLLATSLTLGSGASGGVFSPALFLGATAGGAYGMVLKLWFPHLSVSPPAFAVVGMAGAVGGATGAAMASIVMIFEMTLDYSVIVPLTIVVAISYAIRKALTRDSIYTLKLTLRGDRVPEALEADIQILRRAGEIMETDFATVAAHTPLREFMHSLKPGSSPYAFLVTGDNDIVKGVVTRDRLTSLEQWRPTVVLGDVASTDYIVVKQETVFFEIVRSMRAAKASMALVSSTDVPLAASAIKGVITREEIIDFLAAGRELF
ncbi:MAG TPA: chloride channel protein [Bryobacteraceae bacterium]|nr:chloride channel protein [Bryobacteraceae bacterium]